MVSKWHHRFRTMVRYRLLSLTSVPILLTLMGLIALTLYWTLAYSWKNALSEVRSDLAVAHNSMQVLQREQRLQLHSMAESYQFQTEIKEFPQNVAQWAMTRAHKFGMDFLTVYPAKSINLLPQTLRSPLLAGKEQTFFQVMSAIELEALEPELPAQAEILFLKKTNWRAGADQPDNTSAVR